MERQCHKHAISKHGSMASQILLLKKADAISSAWLSKGLRDSADTITNLLKMKSPNSEKDTIGLHKSRNVPLKQQRPRSFDKNQFTIFHTKAFSRRKLTILFDFFSNLAVQQTASMTSFLLYSTQ